MGVWQKTCRCEAENMSCQVMDCARALALEIKGKPDVRNTRKRAQQRADQPTDRSPSLQSEQWMANQRNACFWYGKFAHPMKIIVRAERPGHYHYCNSMERRVGRFYLQDTVRTVFSANASAVDTCLPRSVWNMPKLAENVVWSGENFVGQSKPTVKQKCLFSHRCFACIFRKMQIWRSPSGCLYRIVFRSQSYFRIYKFDRICTNTKKSNFFA